MMMRDKGLTNMIEGRSKERVGRKLCVLHVIKKKQRGYGRITNKKRCRVACLVCEDRHGHRTRPS